MNDMKTKNGEPDAWWQSVRAPSGVSGKSKGRSVVVARLVGGEGAARRGGRVDSREVGDRSCAVQISEAGEHPVHAASSLSGIGKGRCAPAVCSVGGDVAARRGGATN